MCFTPKQLIIDGHVCVMSEQMGLLVHSCIVESICLVQAERLSASGLFCHQNMLPVCKVRLLYLGLTNE